jgi:hypothetical protein
MCDEVGPIELCDLLLWMVIVVEADWILAPSFSWTQGISGSLSCSDWYCCHGTCSTDA